MLIASECALSIGMEEVPCMRLCPHRLRAPGSGGIGCSLWVERRRVNNRGAPPGPAIAIVLRRRGCAGHFNGRSHRACASEGRLSNYTLGSHGTTPHMDTTCQNSYLQVKKNKTNLWVFITCVFTFFKILRTRFELRTEKEKKYIVNSVIYIYLFWHYSC
jgi:hypothetical protein